MKSETNTALFIADSGSYFGQTLCIRLLRRGSCVQLRGWLYGFLFLFLCRFNYKFNVVKVERVIAVVLGMCFHSNATLATPRACMSGNKVLTPHRNSSTAT